MSAASAGRSALTPAPIRRNCVPSTSFASNSRAVEKIRSASCVGALIDCARAKGYRAVVGDVLSTNSKMFRLMTSLGFSIHPHPDDTAVKRVVKPLAS